MTKLLSLFHDIIIPCASLSTGFLTDMKRVQDKMLQLLMSNRRTSRYKMFGLVVSCWRNVATGTAGVDLWSQSLTFYSVLIVCICPDIASHHSRSTVLISRLLRHSHIGRLHYDEKTHFRIIVFSIK